MVLKCGLFHDEAKSQIKLVMAISARFVVDGFRYSVKLQSSEMSFCVFDLCQGVGFL